MAIRESEALHVTIEKGTIGGDTYWVEHPDWEGEEVALCWRRVRGSDEPGARCSQEAGFGTWHSGAGACRYHGGLAGRNVKTGKNAPVSRSHLAKKINDYIETGDRDSMLDMTYELAAMRVLFQEVVDHFPSPDEQGYSGNVQRLISMVTATGSLLDKISRIQSRNNITAAQVMLLRVTIAEILVKYVPDVGKREMAMKELMDMIPGGEGDTETRMVVM